MPSRGMEKPLRQAFALAYAMQARPTPALASRYFEALRRVLDERKSEQPRGVS